MGLFDDFDVDMDEVDETKAGGFTNIDDGTYPFEIAEARRQHGSNNNPDTEFFVVSYDLDESGQKQDWIVVGNEVDGEITVDDRGVAKVKALLLKLGFDRTELGAVEPEDLEGIRGVLTLKTTTSKKTRRDYQNITIVSVEGSEPAEPAAPAEEPPAAEVKKTVAARQAAKAAPAARTRPARSAAKPAEDDDQNPFS